MKGKGKSAATSSRGPRQELAAVLTAKGSMDAKSRVDALLALPDGEKILQTWSSSHSRDPWTAWQELKMRCSEASFRLLSPTELKQKTTSKRKDEKTEGTATLYAEDWSVPVRAARHGSHNGVALAKREDLDEIIRTCGKVSSSCVQALVILETGLELSGARSQELQAVRINLKGSVYVSYATLVHVSGDGEAVVHKLNYVELKEKPKIQFAMLIMCLDKLW